MLKTRVISAVVMAPPALLAAWMGGYAFAVLVAVAAALMCWEWHGMLTKGFGPSGRLAAVACFLAALLAVSQPHAAVVMVAICAAMAALLAKPEQDGRLWAGLGALYVGLPSVALVWLREDPAMGAAVVWWLLLMVWATDIGAYAFGRMIGGPLLLPAVSPKKTWAGLVGGMICSALVGLGVAAVFGLPAVFTVALLSALGAVVAQVGDLFESWVKRRCGVKDSSSIIPGHGGVLDRVDGLLSAAFVVAAMTLASGQSVLAW
ncbi:phosphatidate cytidylyltransferase [Paramagnetospirillum kuznetsovii]|uniref:Phosphatidate cytidylyltransferase n=1 Tax=Paramagnetospirillum kuznetsovii TaxID=2053833 RepID=A0A364NZS3_9PROT|nr:phosphatidate cytidylyltransferase [Paramagnetospirillum kuznetsovii]RAU22566.1 phosphatidate cytidylyltransferase [Paramagnetospirillum kuznetsovii]